MTLTDEYLQGLVDSMPNYDEPAEPVEGDTAEARDKINEHLRCIGWWEAELQKSADLYQIELARLTKQQKRLEAWNASEQVRVNKRIAYHADVVRGYLAARLRNDQKLRKVSFPRGTLSATVPKTPKLSIEDQKALDAWVMENHPDIWPDPPEPKNIGVMAVKDVVNIIFTEDGEYVVLDKETGELVPGITADLAGPKYDYDTTYGRPFE